MEIVSPLLSSILVYGIIIFFLLYRFSPETRKKINSFFFSSDEAEELLKKVKIIHLSIIESENFSNVEAKFLDYLKREISNYSNLPPKDSKKRKSILLSDIQKAFDVTLMLWHANKSSPSYFFQDTFKEYEESIDNIKKAKENPLSTREAIFADPYFDIRFYGCNIYREPPASLANFLSFIYRSELDSSPFMQDHIREVSNKPLKSESEYLPFTGGDYLRKLYRKMFNIILAQETESQSSPSGLSSNSRQPL